MEIAALCVGLSKDSCLDPVLSAAQSNRINNADLYRQGIRVEDCTYLQFM